MESYHKLLLENKAWAEEKVQDDPKYFSRLADIQRPDFLWIGCSDSRVPANEITNTQPGEIFVHRNIANMVVNTDTNLLAVLEYAVVHLKVKHVIVCGHYGCGGVKASMTNKDYGLINKWLRNIKEVYEKHETELNGITEEQKRLDRLVELNVIEQVNNLAKTTIVQRSWHQRNYPHLHGWVFDLHTGLINPTVEILPGAEISPIYRYDFKEVSEKQDDLSVPYKAP